jgi:preprotein translocase subunit SecG
VSSTAFGPRGTQTLLAKITIGAAIVFMLSALFISVPYFAGSRSVLQSVDEQPTPATTPAPQQSVPAAPVTTENNAVTTNTNAATDNSNGAQKSKPSSDNKQSNQNKK